MIKVTRSSDVYPGGIPFHCSHLSSLGVGGGGQGGGEEIFVAISASQLYFTAKMKLIIGSLLISFAVAQWLSVTGYDSSCSDELMWVIMLAY